MKRSLLLLAVLLAGPALAQNADPASDAPEGGRPRVESFKDALGYDEALRAWRSPEDVNDWIGARFSYDLERAMRLSESQRARSGSLPILAPAQFFAAPSGVCVDLSRFAVETLRSIDASLAPRYLMIEFAPVKIAGNTLRLHWVASYRRDGAHYFFADSKRPGVIAGPYPSAQAFLEDYGKYRGREIVAFRELDSYQRTPRTRAAKRQRAD